MDQLSAHLDRGWDLITRGDFHGARASARRALELDADSPEAHNLLGYAAAQEGDADEALEHYREAMSLDEGYIDPMLNAAEVLIHPLQEFDEAIALCDEVLGFVEAPEEITDAMLLKFDALLALDDMVGARALLDRLPEEKLNGPQYPFMLGRAWYEAGEPERADAFLIEAIKADPDNPDAHYYLGLVRDERRDTRGAIMAFLESRELDMASPKAPWTLPNEQFLKSIERAVQAVDPELMKFIDGALVLGADAPGMEAVAEGLDPRVPVLIDGLYPTEPEATLGPGVQAIPVRVFVYQRNIERLCAGVETLEDKITWQVTDEIKHILGHQQPLASPAAPPAAQPAAQPAVPPEEARQASKKPRKKS